MENSQRTAGFRKRLFFILWLAGIAGVLSFLLVDLSALIASFPRPEGTPPPELPPPVILKIASVLQPAVLMTIAVVVGLFLAPKVGLHAPAAEAAADRSPVWPALRSQILPGILVGVAWGIILVTFWALVKRHMPAEFVSRAEDFNQFLPAATRIFYGGFTEEILLRWGMMTFFVWVMWLAFQRRATPPRPAWFIIAILLTSLLFGVGHLPIASALAGGLTLPTVAWVIAANSLFGIAAGFLYWRQGLESAIIAHISAHIVLLTAISLAL